MLTALLEENAGMETVIRTLYDRIDQIEKEQKEAETNERNARSRTEECEPHQMQTPLDRVPESLRISPESGSGIPEDTIFMKSYTELRAQYDILLEQPIRKIGGTRDGLGIAPRN